MRRILTVFLTVVMVLALMPGVVEAAENGVHFAQEGHLAHDAPDGDQHTMPGSEHGCTGTAHLCSCHVSLSCLAVESISPAVQPPPVPFRARAHEFPAWMPSNGIDHPPRA